MVEDDPVASVLSMVRGAWITMAVRAGVVLGVFEALDEARTVEDAARLTESDPSSLGRLLRTMTDLGLVAETSRETYRNTGRGACLRQDHPSRLCDLVLMQATLPNLGAWLALDTAVRTGSGVYEQVNGRTHWEDLAADPQAQRSFNAAMARRASAQVSAVLEGGDLSDGGTVVDVGGGRGALLASILHARPTLSGVLLDQPIVAAEAELAFAAAGLADRATCVGGDFFAAVPAGGDVYVIANVLHDWDDADATAILTAVRAAIPEDGRLLLVEHVLGAPGRSPGEQRDLHLVDLHMLVMFGARERDQQEYDALLVDAGFTPSRLRGSGDWNVLESRPAHLSGARPR